MPLKNMDLVDKVKKFGKKIGLAGVLGSSFYLSGCGPVLMGLGAGTPGPQGAALSAFGAGVTQLEAAEAGKSDVKQNVYVNGGGNGGNRNSVRENHSDIIDGQNKFFTCNYFKGDLNGNELLDKIEFEGFGKNKFYKSEEISLSWLVYNRSGANLILELFGP